MPPVGWASLGYGVTVMAQNLMQKFINTQASMPQKRKAEERRRDFDEIYASFAHDKAAGQSSRCSQCGVPFCQIGCPVANNIPDWLMLTASGRLQEAYHTSFETNALPEICGRICPQDRLCEGLCVLEQSGHEAVTIGAVEKYITETAFAENWVEPIKPLQERSETVAIIGAGPAGIAAAVRLRELGYQVQIYDRYDRMGGLLIYGIPGFKLDKSVVERRYQWLVDSGVSFRLNCQVGVDISFAEIRSQHQAVLIATGVYKSREIDTLNHQLQHIYQALDYLSAANRVGLGDKVPAYQDGSLNAKGKHVVVIGGGDTAMDCVRTAVRQGAKSVKCVYRRDRENMPGSAREVQNAVEEGVEFLFLSQPCGFMGRDKVTGVQVQPMRLGDPDVSGRRYPVNDETTPSYKCDADMVILALGFEPEALPALWQEPTLPVSRHGTIIADGHTGATKLAGVYAAGDIVRGASLVVWGVRDGQVAAKAIGEWLAAGGHLSLDKSSLESEMSLMEDTLQL